MAGDGRIEAVLGPTNTGKTHYAIERMLCYRTGVIGLPLRLLAREVYDKIKAVRGPSVVALVTGEERIVPDRAQYWVCTVEAMPEGMGADFVAVDEIQLCADPERGHVFTDRLLRARGLHETLFLGASAMRSAIAALVPGVQFQGRERFSELLYTGAKKLSRMPPRSATVGFSVENVYAMAELLRRQKGGAAVVMGALSPRTRNAQVDLYQNGDVDHLVATDAIGMGLNLDIGHVAFSALSKFDGRRMRPLQPNELAQIAGRAGRYTQAGTFGVTGEARPLSDDLADAIVSNRFTPITRLQWRNANLAFGTVARLIASLEEQTDNEWLTRARDADDLLALKTLAAVGRVMERAIGGVAVRRLWDVCRIPDFRGISHAEHAGLLENIFVYMCDLGRIPDDWMAQQVKRIDRTDGDIDALSKRLAYIRTWTYVAQRNGWLDDESHWRDVTRSVEDRLSDVLHERLTQRFVDRRTSVLLRRLKQKESLVAEVNENGEVTVEGQFVGRLEGFRFIQDKSATPDEAKTLRQASVQALVPQFHLRADRFYNAPDPEIDYTEQGGLMWGASAVGKLVAGSDPLKPRVQAFVDDEAGPEVAQKVERRLQHFIDRKVAALFEPLLALQRDETLNGLARGFAFRLVEAMGVLPREGVADDVKALDQDARGGLRKHGVRFGQFTVFMPLLLKPAPTRLRMVLWSLANNLDEFPESPPPGLVTVPAVKDMPDGYHALAGYRAAGTRAIRIDMLERLADMLRAENSRSGFEAKPDMLSITGTTLEQFADLMKGLGYAAERGERAKARPVAAVAAKAVALRDDVTAVPAEADASVVGAETESESPVAAASLEPQTGTAEALRPSSEAEGGEGLVPAPVVADLAIEGVPAQNMDAPEAHSPAEPLRAEAPAPAAVSEDETASAGTDANNGVAGTDALAEGAPQAEPAAPGEPVETEIFYTFTWAPKRRSGGRPQPAGKPKGASGRPPQKGKPKGRRDDAKPSAPKVQAPRPERSKPIDPDNPFAAALMGFRDRS
jgi:ATP-dependent RNA helicase SUPV3L1/SUV3